MTGPMLLVFSAVKNTENATKVTLKIMLTSVQYLTS